MKPINSQSINTEHQAIFIIDNEEDNGVYLFSQSGVKKIEPDYAYFEDNLVRFDFLYIENYEKISESLYISRKEFPQLEEMLQLAGYCVISSKEGFYYIVDSREERNLPLLELQYP